MISTTQSLRVDDLSTEESEPEPSEVCSLNYDLKSTYLIFLMSSNLLRSASTKACWGDPVV